MRRLLLALALVLAFAGCGSATRGIPPGFRAETAAAFGPSDIWILGRGNTLVRSTDGGAHFAQVSFPPLRSVGDVPSVVFANPSDGFAYEIDGRGPLYATHDGGSSWTASITGVANVAVGGGHVFATTLRYRLERAPVGGGKWTELPAAQVSGTSLAARGSHVWLLGPPAQRANFPDTIQVSSDSGQNFTSYRGPCSFDFPGRLAPAGRSVVWAVCATGMLAGLSASTNGGRTFAGRSFSEPNGHGRPQLTNAGEIAPFSPRIAVLDGGYAPLLRTTDNGKHWRRVQQPGRIYAVRSLQATTRRVGVALVQTRSSGPRQLWRTTDAGASWHRVAGIP